MAITISGNGDMTGDYTFAGDVDVNGKLEAPAGNTASRPATGQPGEIRFNTDNGEMEFWSTTSTPAQWRKVRQGELPAFSVRYLIAAGGGAGGASDSSWVCGGGGGAGGYLAASNVTSTFSLNTAYTVTVGAGGARTVVLSATNRPAGNDGGNSVLGSLTAIGGGGGGGGQMGNYTMSEANGQNGGSGGGVSGYGNYGSGNVIGNGTSGQGYNGGGPANNHNYCGGGGGGAGGVGVDGGSAIVSLDTGGDGGPGVSNDITGTAVIYCAGGGGGTYTTYNESAQGKGGSNGAGGRGGFNWYHDATWQTNGRYSDRPGQTTGSGGGGGGGFNSSPNWARANEYDGAAGADGRVIIRIPDSYQATFSAGVTFTATNMVDDTIVYECTAGTGTVTFGLA